MTVSIVFGAGGQDGSYLCEHLLGLNHIVIAVVRRSSYPNRGRIAHIKNRKFLIEEGDVTDPLNVAHLIKKHQPHEVYNLAAQSHVHTSFAEPSHTTDVVYKGALNILEAARQYSRPPRVYQASSSEMFGDSVSYMEWGLKNEKWSEWRQKHFRPSKVHNMMGQEKVFQNEKTPFIPQSPYAIAKLAAHNLVRLYRDSYGLFACSGILFNHESSRRAAGFVTQKVAQYVGNYTPGLSPLLLGNLEAKRDWGFAGDYVCAMQMMMAAEAPDDYVIATGEVHSVRELVEVAFNAIGKQLEWNGNGVEEIGIVDDEVVVRIDPGLFRPCEVPYLRGEPQKAHNQLGWSPKTSFQSLIEQMVESSQVNSP